jgi:hypothetical protein
MSKFSKRTNRLFYLPFSVLCAINDTKPSEKLWKDTGRKNLVIAEVPTEV